MTESQSLFAMVTNPIMINADGTSRTHLCYFYRHYTTNFHIISAVKDPFTVIRSTCGVRVKGEQALIRSMEDDFTLLSPNILSVDRLVP